MPRESEPETTVELIRGLFTDARELAVAHVDGIKLEMKQEIQEVKRASMLAGIGIAVFVIAGIVLAGAITQLIALALPQWASHLIVAAAFAAVGLVAVQALRRTHVELPRHELEKTKEDAEWVARRTRDAIA